MGPNQTATTVGLIGPGGATSSRHPGAKSDCQGQSCTRGEKTVKSHVSNILAKLHLDDRTQVAVFAWRHGIAHH